MTHRQPEPYRVSTQTRLILASAVALVVCVVALVEWGVTGDSGWRWILAAGLLVFGVMATAYGLVEWCGKPDEIR